jgi:diguanylate cyclase (GGDEF)-like protein/PAS domain S-box-containing protein
LPDYIYVKDTNGRYVLNNLSHVKALGASSSEEVAGKSDFDFYPKELAERYRTDEQEIISSGRPLVGKEERSVNQEGNERWHWSTKVPLRDESGKVVGFVGMTRDITEQKTLETRLEHQAFHDSLTGLANRVLFMNRLEHALVRIDRREEPMAVLFMDLDNFKVINDSLGHEVGDLLLVEVSRRLKECVRPEDTVARFGGDEFVILLEGIMDLSGATRVADRINKVLTAPFHFEGHEVFVSISIGIAPAIKASGEPEDLLRNADLALYRAKKKGKAQYRFFDESMGTESLKRLKLESGLRKALEREEFRIYYQPKISISDNKIVSLEALIRWEHPERGLLEPDEFLPVAEESGLVVQIGEWVLDEVCRQGRDWQERFADESPPRVCTNVSARQFLQTDLVGRVTKSLQKSGLGAQGLSLEIPEGVLMDEPESNAEKLRALKDLGIHIVIDDFGTAFSSLSYLKNFPLNFLKVDRSLIAKLGDEPEDKAVVAAMINLAKGLGWAVTAQGVETKEQLALLRELGCDIVQGYYFSRPVMSEEATKLLEGDLSTMANSRRTLR